MKRFIFVNKTKPNVHLNRNYFFCYCNNFITFDHSFIKSWEENCELESEEADIQSIISIHIFSLSLSLFYFSLKVNKKLLWFFLSLSFFVLESIRKFSSSLFLSQSHKETPFLSLSLYLSLFKSHLGSFQSHELIRNFVCWRVN